MSVLGIGADDQYGMPRQGQSCAEIDRGGGFADSALTADQADDPAVDGAPGSAAPGIEIGTGNIGQGRFFPLGLSVRHRSFSSKMGQVRVAGS